MELSVIVVNLLTLTVLEIVLGVDNLVFISIVSSRLPTSQQKTARQMGLFLALFGRFALLLTVAWIIKLNNPLLTLFSQEFSGRDIFMLLGGLFLLIKGTLEIHHEIEQHENPDKQAQKGYGQFFSVIVQIAIFDLVFSLDSILTAIGLTKEIWIMMIAVTIAVLLMILASEPLSRFVHRHPSVKMLALSFLLLIGMVLVADGFGYEIPKGYIYFSICFSLLVEALNTFRKKKRKLLKSKKMAKTANT